MRLGSRRFWMTATALWAAVIFATSCTFIERSVFINFVGRFIPQGMPQHLWISFWGALGIFVVKAYHVAEYLVLCTLLFSVLKAWWKTKPQLALPVAVTVSLLYAVSDEWHQTFVPGRGGTWVDVVIDSCGIALASIWIVRRRKRPSIAQG